MEVQNVLAERSDWFKCTSAQIKYPTVLVGGYDIDPMLPIYQIEHPSNPEIISLKETPLPEQIKVTSIYSCMDCSVKPYSNCSLNGATNVVVCPDSNHTPTADHPFDEVISEVSILWSLYYQPFVMDRIIKGLE